MEITLNGQLVTCTPDEYARLIQLGLIPTQSSGTKVSPIQITPQPKPKPDQDFWKKNHMDVVPLYGCIGDSITPFVEVKFTQQADTSTASTSAVDDTPKYYAVKKKDSDEWWSYRINEFLTKNEADARLFSDPNEAQHVIDFVGTRFGELTIVPAKR